MVNQKVYIVSNTGHDYTPAERRGDLVFIFGSKVNVFATDKMVKEVEQCLKDSSSEDFLLASGAAPASCAAFSVLMRKHAKVNFLIWSFRNQVYEIRTVYKSQFSDC